MSGTQAPGGASNPPAGASNPAPGAPAPGASNAPPGGDWSASLDAELGQLVKVKGWKSPADALRSYASLEKTIGQDRVAIPRDGAPDAEWDGVFQKLGMPAEAKEYGLARPADLAPAHYDEKAAEAFREIARKARLTKAQAAAVHDWWASRTAAGVRESEARLTTQRTEAENALRQEYGAGFEGAVQAGQRAARELGGADFIAFLEESGAGNHPQMVRLFAKLGKLMSEDSVVGGRTGFVADAASARREIERLRGEAAMDPKHPLVNKRHPEYRAMNDRLQNLYQLAHGSGADGTGRPRRL